MPEYKYKGLTIQQMTRRTRVVRALTQWDIFDGEKVVKRGFGSVDMAKHYIDVCRRNEDDRGMEADKRV